MAPHELQQITGNAKSYVIETEPGLVLRLGDVAFAAGASSAEVSIDDIADYGSGEGSPGSASAVDTVPNSGGYFDFEITNLPLAGNSANIVIPQFAPLPANARYRKYHPTDGWQDFVVDSKNKIASALGQPGICPRPGDSAYSAGLTEGHHCIQLTIEDGGPNDTDRIANFVIEDPGTIGVVEKAAPDPDEPPVPQTGGGGGGSLNLVALITLLILLRFRETNFRKRKLDG